LQRIAYLYKIQRVVNTRISFNLIGLCMTPILPHIAEVLSKLFDKADELALTTKFIKRRRKITGSNFIKTLLFAWMQKAAPSVEGIARAGFSHALQISAQGIEQRLTETACHFLKAFIGYAVAEKVCAEQSVEIGILNRFTAVYITDTSTIILPNELKSHYIGTGGKSDSNQSMLKLDTCIELKTGGLTCGILQGTDSDSRSPLAEKHYEKGALRLQDLGYFNLHRMKEQSERGEYWLSRVLPNTKILDKDKQDIDLQDYLISMTKMQNYFEVDVFVGKQEQVAARLMAYRLPQEAASRRREKLKKSASKHGRLPTARNLALCDWSLYMTNVEKTKLTLKECLILYRVRWQIELLFKLWKTHSQIDQSLSRKSYRILCEIYIKLLVVLIQHWILLTGLWNIHQRSLVKGTQLIKEQAARLAEAIGDKNKLLAFLAEMSKRFQQGCLLNKRKKSPNTIDQLIECSQFS